jgi:hypothetical protein
VSELPCIGFGITVVDPGPATDVINAKVFGRRSYSRNATSRRYSPNRPKRLLRAYVVSSLSWNDTRGHNIVWKSGIRTGEVWENDEMVTWTRGHGPEARAAFLAVRALTGVK